MAHDEATIAESVRWSRSSIAAGAAGGAVPLTHGTVGEGGPHALLVCGQHGDEAPWSALAVRRVLASPASALKGRLTVVLAANPLAAEQDARNAPLDTLDLNLCYPGRADGSHTERLATHLASLTQGIDLLIDLHGGGSWCVNAFTYAFEGAEDLAAEVGAPFVIAQHAGPGTLAGEAAARGARVVAIEIGGRSQAEQRAIDDLADALLRVLRAVDVMGGPEAPPPATPSRPVGDLRILRPPSGGVLVPEVREGAVGTVVPGGTVLGTLHDLHTLEPRHRFVAPYPETAVLLLRPHIAVIEGGAMTYAVGRPVA